jgi:tagatose-6-phosphate ketose/aldose isomerase
MNPLSKLLALPDAEKRQDGLLYTPAEIAQQPVTWQSTHKLFQDLKSNLASFLHQAHEERWPICLIGAGTSDYIGYSVANVLRRGWECDVSVVASTDMLPNREDIILPGRKYLWIHFSRSGESQEGAAVLEQGLASCPNVKHLVISCNEQGRMTQLAQESPNAFAVVLDDKVNDRSLAMTSSFTNMVIFAQALSSLWAPDSFEEKLEVMSHAADFLLDQGATLAHMLSQEVRQGGIEKACFVGTGGLGATARESALKLLELTSGQVQTVYETTLGLRHGPMSSLNMCTLFTAFLSNGESRRRYDADLLNEVRAKRVVRKIVAVGGSDAAADYSLNCAAFAAIPDAYRPAVDVIFGQLLGLFTSIEIGMKPDSPSPSGVISRVVEKFAIYA